MPNRRAILAAAPLVLAGCASIIKGESQEIAINSMPSGADVRIVDEGGTEVFAGVTPVKAQLKKKKSYFHGRDYTIELSHAGHAPREIKLKRSVSAWYIAGNIVFGGLIGWLIVDPLTGAMWTYDPEEIDETLTSSSSGLEQGLSLHVVLLKEAPPAVRQSMVPLG